MPGAVDSTLHHNRWGAFVRKRLEMVRRVGDRAGAPIIIGKAEMPWGHVHHSKWQNQ